MSFAFSLFYWRQRWWQQLSLTVDTHIKAVLDRLKYLNGHFPICHAQWSRFRLSAVFKNSLHMVLKQIFCCYICRFECWLKFLCHVSLSVLYWFSWIHVFVLLCVLSLKRISFQWLSCTNKGHMNTKQRYPHLSLFSAHGPLTFTLRGDGLCVPSSLKPLMPTAYRIWVHDSHTVAQMSDHVKL